MSIEKIFGQDFTVWHIIKLCNSNIIKTSQVTFTPHQPDIDCPDTMFRSIMKDKTIKVIYYISPRKHRWYHMIEEDWYLCFHFFSRDLCLFVLMFVFIYYSQMIRIENSQGPNFLVFTLPRREWNSLWFYIICLIFCSLHGFNMVI